MKTYEAKDAAATVRSILVYGESGVGKTRFAATAQFYEPWSPCLLAVVGAEQAVSVRDYEGLHVIELVTLDDIEWLKNYLLGGQPERAALGWPTFKSLVFDGITEAQLTLMDVKLRQAEKGRSIMPDSLGVLPPAAVLRDWGTSFNWTMNLVRAFTIDFPVPVIFTALERYDKDEVTGDMMVSPAVPGQLAGLVPAKSTVTMRLVRSRTYGVTASEWRQLEELSGVGIPLDNVGLLWSDGKFKAVNRLGPERWCLNPTVSKLLAS